MINLFSQWYLDYSTFLKKDEQHFILFENTNRHPAAKEFGLPYEDVPSALELLDQQYNSDWELLFKTVSEMGQKNKFFFYSDRYYLIKVLCSYWKSIFDNAPEEKLFELYRLYEKGFFVKKQYIDSQFKFMYTSFFSPVSREEFGKIYKLAESSKVMREASLSHLSLTFLLLGSVASGREQERAIFIKRVYEHLMMQWKGNLIELKEEILSKYFYKIDKIVDNINLSSLIETGIKKSIDSHPELSWMTSPELEEGNLAALIENYGIGLFITQRKRVELIRHGLDNSSENLKNANKIVRHHEIESLKYFGQFKWEDLLSDLRSSRNKMSILKASLMDLTGQFVVEFLLDKILNDEIEYFEDFKLCGEV